MMEGTNNQTTQEAPLMDLMVMDSEESLKEKKQTWEDIFLRCPDFSDYVIKLFKDGGELAITGALDMLKACYEAEEELTETEK